MKHSEYADYSQILENCEHGEPVDLTAYYAINNLPDPLDKVPVPMMETYSATPPKTPQVPSVDEIIQYSRESKLSKQAESLGFDEIQRLKAEALKLIKTGDISRNISVPDPLMDSSFGIFCSEVAAKAQFPYGSTFMTGLACFSAATLPCYSVEYEDGHPLPLGLYTCVSQPSGTGKSTVIGAFTEELNVQIEKQTRKTKKENMQRGKNDELIPIPTAILSNATPEALDNDMNASDSGKFIIISSEKGAVNRVLNIGVKDRAVDNDVVLKGFVGERHASARISRVGFRGQVFGAIALLSQPGMAELVINTDAGSGLAERFIFANEESLIGSRPKHRHRISKESSRGYNDKIRALTVRQFASPSRDVAGLSGLRFCERGYQFITDLHDVREPKLKEYNDAGAHLMTGALSKIDQQIMKIAANLHIYENLTKGGDVTRIIDYKWVEPATILAFELLSKLEGMLIDQGEMGEDAKEMVILAKFDNTQRMTERQLIDRAKANRKFNGRDDVRDVIHRMIKEGKLRVKGKDLVRG